MWMDGRTGESLEVLPELALSLVCRASASPTSEAALVSPTTVKQTAHHTTTLLLFIFVYNSIQFTVFPKSYRMKSDSFSPIEQYPSGHLAFFPYFFSRICGYTSLVSSFSSQQPDGLTCQAPFSGFGNSVHHEGSTDHSLCVAANTCVM